MLTVGREKIQVDGKELLQRLCDRYETGLEVLQIVLQDVNPPDPVKPAFNEVNQAIQEKERLINEAWADYNQTVPNARGEAERVVRAAEGYALERVNNARGDVARFVNIYDEYRKAPDVTRKRLYLETLNEVLPKTGRKLDRRFLDEGAAAAPEPRPGQAGGEAVKRRPPRRSSSSSGCSRSGRRSTRSPRPSRSSSPSSASRSGSRTPTPACT